MNRMIVIFLVTAFFVGQDAVGPELPETRVMFLDPIAGPRNLAVGEACFGRKGVESWEAIDDGHRMRQAGEEIGAISHWKRLAIRYQETDVEAACAALDNVAALYSNRGEKAAAVSYYKLLLAVGSSSEGYAPYSACRHLSDLYVELDNIDESLRFARMAQCQCSYPAMLFCGVGRMSEEYAIDRRIEALSAAKLTRSKVALKTIKTSGTIER
ncbi:MAG: hypothetical protein JNL58_00660 [Planctomyces sp.]|nr:hypothetical protein [Planctomyces sp.]